jgi:hypothetical protein
MPGYKTCARWYTPDARHLSWKEFVHDIRP